MKKQIYKKSNNIIVLPSYTWFIFFFIITLIFSFFYTKHQSKKSYSEITKKMDSIFKGGKRVAGYIIGDELEIRGNLYDVSVKKDSFFLSSWVNFYVGDKLIYTQTNKNPDSLSLVEKKKLSLVKDLVQYYEVKHGGSYTKPVFRLAKAEKFDDGFNITLTFSGDMAYKVLDSSFYVTKTPYYETKRVEPFIIRDSYGKIIKDYNGNAMYSLPNTSTKIKYRFKKIYYSNNRPSIYDCYKNSVEYLAFEIDDEPTQKGDFNDINYSLKNLKSEFYEIDQSYPKYYIKPFTYDTIYIKSDYTNHKFIPTVRSNKITSLTDLGDGNVFTSQYIVWFKSITNTFNIKKREWMFTRNFALNSTTGFIISLIIYLFFKYRNRIVISKP